jgi:Two component regulator propeller
VTGRRSNQLNYDPAERRIIREMPSTRHRADGRESAGCPRTSTRRLRPSSSKKQVLSGNGDGGRAVCSTAAVLARARVRGFRRFAARLACAAAGLWLAAASGSALNPSTPIAQYGRDVWDGDSGLPQNSVEVILQTRDGYLWLGTQEGLVRFDGVRFTIFDTRNSHAMHDDWVKSLSETRDGTLWVGTQAGLLR